MNNLAATAIKTFRPDGDQCDQCKEFIVGSLSTSTVFTNGIGFKDLCVKCKENNEFVHNNNVNLFLTKAQFLQQRSI